MGKGRNKKSSGVEVNTIKPSINESKKSRNESVKGDQNKSPSASKHNHIVSMSEAQVQKRSAKPSKKQANGSSNQSNSSLKKKIQEKNEREKLVLWRHPIQTLHYSLMETLCLLSEYLYKLWNNKLVVTLTSVVICALYLASLAEGPHQVYLTSFKKEYIWLGWWSWLGFLSSVGLGTGLHTFLLYLGPHIASVTMAAYSCGALNFPSPPYPDEIVCPDEKDLSIPITMWTIMSKVRYEAFFWGAGTALGELPPYFMARGARLSGIDPDDEEMQEFEAELKRLKERPENMSFMDKAKLSIERLVEKVGFFGILACASIPNPLFDLAGLTCGHFLVPFWTFFLATLIGKAVIKMHIQKLFVIIAFDESLLARAVNLLAMVPLVGPLMQQPFQEFLEKQKQGFRRKEPGAAVQGGGSILSWCFEKFIMIMVMYFIVSIVNSFAQSYYKRLHKKKTKKSASD